MKEYYSRLFLKEGSSLEEVKKAHRKLVKKFHPDKNSGSNDFTEEFKLIQEAYEKLNSYLGQDKKTQNTYSYNNKEENYSNQTSEGIVKREAQYAEAGEGETNDFLFNTIIRTLILLFIFCCFYASISQKNLILKIILLISLTAVISTIVFNMLKSNLNKFQ